MKILFLSTRRTKPSFRFRVEQFLPAFRERGHDCEVDFLSASAHKRFWLYRRLSDFDAVVLQKRLLNRAELFLFRQRTKRLIYDVDDAVMLDGQGNADGRRSSRFRAMARIADLVICGNSYLAEQARPFSERVEIVPTCIDTQKFRPSDKPMQTGPMIIGWTGSRSTNRYLNDVLPAIARLAPHVVFKFLSDTSEGVELERLGEVPHQFIPWSPAVEISETAKFDVGIMPLPDDPWTKGKCGFKALQYMGLGIPAVCSPVGVNAEIITHGQNGLLARTADDWHKSLSELLAQPRLREQLGTAGRKRVEEHYSLQVQAPRLVSLLEEVALPKKHLA